MRWGRLNVAGLEQSTPHSCSSWLTVACGNAGLGLSEAALKCCLQRRTRRQGHSCARNPSSEEVAQGSGCQRRRVHRSITTSDNHSKDLRSNQAAGQRCGHLQRERCWSCQPVQAILTCRALRALSRDQLCSSAASLVHCVLRQAVANQILEAAHASFGPPGAA